MPDIELQHIVSCNSADKNNPAENLLKPDGSYKWKSTTAGEKSISCIIQLSKSSQIHSIDIGNEGSAFVEILVGKATATDDKDFEVLLVASSFMSPLESRNETNKTSVRMFGPDDLNKQTANQSWDRIKIVCSQPFSKLFQYGLSFIKFRSPPLKENEEPKVKKLGAFTINEDDDADDIHIGSIFANRLNKTLPLTPKAGAAIRLASKHPEDLIKTSLDEVGKKRPAESPPLTTPLAKTPKQENIKPKDDSDKEAQPVTLKRQSTSLSSVASSTSVSSSEKTTLKRTNTEPNKASSSKTFRKIMESVVFVLSGFENPGRGQLRDMALEMGAKYRPDWGKGCTHLVCAFPNTPKYQQVAGKGKIVTKAWIKDCYNQKKLLPWRGYRLGKAPSPPTSSDEEDEPPVAVHKPSTTTSKETLKKDIQKDNASPKNSDSESESDKVKKNSKVTEKKDKSPAETKKTITSSAIKEDDPFARSTDEEDDGDESTQNNSTAHNIDDNIDSGLPDLPDFFTDKVFFFYGEMEAAEKRLLTRYIAAYNGEVSHYISKAVNFVVTSKQWDSNFDQAMSENPSLIFVKPKWIYACHEKNKLMPYQHHVIIP
ncbi:DNA repair protein XRCC1-like isoform X1 [Biomphalaria glabrata]|nr:DNA repair protein XRCC1-like isoform X1 [Biomphalaria glabrata]